MQSLRLVLLIAASCAIAFALYSADKSGVSPTSLQFLKTQGVAFLGGALGATAIFMKGKAEKK
jgi:hypothetical protein